MWILLENFKVNLTININVKLKIMVLTLINNKNENLLTKMLKVILLINRITC